MESGQVLPPTALGNIKLAIAPKRAKMNANRKNSESQPFIPISSNLSQDPPSVLKNNSCLLPKIKMKLKFEHQDFSFVPIEKNEDLHSHIPTEILDILSGTRPPALYRSNFYSKYMQSLNQNSFGHTDTISYEFSIPKILRDNSEKLIYLKNKYKREKVKNVETQQINIEDKQELKLEIKEFEKKIGCLKYFPKHRISQQDIYYLDDHRLWIKEAV